MTYSGKEMAKKEKINATAFEMLGGVEGVRALAKSFYDIMSSLPEARRIRDMHPSNLEMTCENFTLFLCGWLGGPPLYKKKYGSFNLTGLHAPLKINEPDRDMWLSCMEQAIEKLDIEDDLKKRLLERFRVPAEKIRNWCQQQFMQSSNLKT
jgi:hemoglobin